MPLSAVELLLLRLDLSIERKDVLRHHVELRRIVALGRCKLVLRAAHAASQVAPQSSW